MYHALFWLLTLSSIFVHFYILFELHNFNIKLCSGQYNKIDLLHLIVTPLLGGGWQYTFSTKTRQTSCANEQSI
jgi:hypothetical protein